MPGKAAAATGQAPAPAVGKADETRFAEHTPQGRLTAQRGLYAGPAPIVSKDLYAEVLWGSVVRDRAAVVLSQYPTFFQGLECKLQLVPLNPARSEGLRIQAKACTLN